MAQLQGRKILCARDAAVHYRALPARPRGETRGSTAAERVWTRRMFVFFSNRLGCMGSILASLAA
jgi:hypothetical protein